MLLMELLRKGAIAGAFGALMLLGACTMTVQPEAGTGQTAGQDTVDIEGSAIAEFVLPDGTTCFFSGTGVTVEFDGKRANYTCTAVDATESTTQTLAILDDPVIVGPTEYAVDLATIAPTEGGFELHASEVVTFTAWQITLADGRVCLHAGFGATMGFEGERLNYTCDTGDSTAEEVGLMGELTSHGGGVWTAQITEIGREGSGFVQLATSEVAVAQVSGVEAAAGTESETTPASDSTSGADLIGETWQWVETVYGDGTVVTADDPSRYTVTFNADGTAGVQFDCNSGGGPYTVDGSSLVFGELVSTLMGCAGSSQVDIFAKDLMEVYSYVIEDGHLFLSLQLDSGIMEFAPVGETEGAATPAATEEATAEMTEEATAEATVEATEEATAEATEEATVEATEEATEEATVEATEEATAEATAEATEEPTEEATAEATEEATEEAGEEAAGGELAGTTWQWQQSIYEGDMVVAASDPSRYTITFNEDGSLAAQLDCNSGQSSYTLDGTDLSFGSIATTRMACADDSQETIFAQDLAMVVAYTFVDGNLHLTLEDDGVMEFTPVE